MNSKEINGKECFVLKNDSVELAVTKIGGHMAPVNFFDGDANAVQPYYVSPWQEENLQLDEPVLRSLRGDFFCLPFGANPSADNPYSGHGDPAGTEWKEVKSEKNGNMTTLTLENPMPSEASGKGRVVKELSIADGQSVIYCRDTVSGFSGKTSLGHHATLGIHNGSLTIRTSPIQFGYTNPYDVLFTQDREYYSLAPLKRFTDLAAVPTVWKVPETTDCRVFPLREGYVDILQIFQEAADSAAGAAGKTPGWVTAVCREGGYLWYSLKDVDVLPSTVFWMENHGRHGSPWNGRNACIGLEDVCAYFANGLSDSAAENILNTREGVKTAQKLDGTPYAVSCIQGIVRIPDDFDAVAGIDFSDSGITLHAESGVSVETEVDWRFVFGG